jgi:hypothetical protein
MAGPRAKYHWRLQPQFHDSRLPLGTVCLLTENYGEVDDPGSQQPPSTSAHIFRLAFPRYAFWDGGIYLGIAERV